MKLSKLGEHQLLCATEEGKQRKIECAGYCALETVVSFHGTRPDHRNTESEEQDKGLTSLFFNFRPSNDLRWINK